MLAQFDVAIKILAEAGYSTNNDSESVASSTKNEGQLVVPEAPDTIFSRGIFAESGKGEIVGAVEDKLMNNPSELGYDHKSLLRDIANNPMRSYLATWHRKQVNVDIADLGLTSEKLAKKIEHHNAVMADRRSHIDNLFRSMPDRKNSFLAAEAKFKFEKKMLSEEKEDLETNNAELSRQVAAMEKDKRDIKVVGTMQKAFCSIRDAEPSTLPYASVDSRQRVADLALTFGVTGNEAISSLTLDDHVKIAKGCILFGYEYSIMFASTGLEAIYVARRNISVMREQTARLFLLHAEQVTGKRGHDDGLFASPPRNKKARTSMKFPSMKSPEANAYMAKKRTPSKGGN